MKRVLLAVAAIALFLTTATLPSMADGNPAPTVCTPLHCGGPSLN
ncbi:MAG: hypothetical protein WAK29_02570 [Terriglobales bacterium]